MAADGLPRHQQGAAGDETVRIPGQDFCQRVRCGREIPGRQPGLHRLIKRRLKKIALHLLQRGEPADKAGVIGNRLGETLLPELRIRQFEIGPPLLRRERQQPLHRRLKGLLALGHPAVQPETPAEVQFGFSDQRALGQVVGQRAKRRRGLLKIISRRRIGRAVLRLAGAFAGLTLAQPQFTQCQQRQVGHRGLGILAQKTFQHLSCLRDLILRQEKLGDF